MKINLTFLLIAFTLPVTILGQQFQRSFGGDGYDVIASLVQLESQDYLAFGGSSSFGPVLKGYLIKMDGMGNYEEGRLYNFMQGSEFSVALKNEAGNIFFAGNTTSMLTNSAEALIGEMDTDGEILWAKSLNGPLNEVISCAAITADGGFIAAGHSASFTADSSFDNIVIKVAANGDIEWAKEFESPGYDRIASIVESPEGGYFYFAHHSNDNSVGYDLNMVKLDDGGNIEWSRALSGPGIELASEIYCLEDGYLLGGDTDSYGEGLNEVFLMKVDFTGLIEWQNVYGGFSHDHLTSIAEGEGNFIVVGGVTGSIGGGGLDMMSIEISKDGFMTWSKAYGGDDKDVCYDIIDTPDGGYALAGYSRSFTDTWVYNAYIVKTNDRGDCVCNTVWNDALTANEAFFESGVYEITSAELPALESTTATYEIVSPLLTTELCELGEIVDAGEGGEEHSDIDVASHVEDWENHSITIIPNLQSSSLMVELDVYSDATVNVYNLGGELIGSSPVSSDGKQTVEVKIQGWSEGIYFVSIVNQHIHVGKKIYLR